MKVIDLLNKIANGEEVPKKIKYDNDIWEYDEMARDYLLIDKSGEEYLICEELNLMFALNDEVEIIEEDKKIRKLDWIEENTSDKMQNSCLTAIEKELLDSNFKELGNKINEIIDYINKEDK